MVLDRRDGERRERELANRVIVIGSLRRIGQALQRRDTLGSREQLGRHLVLQHGVEERAVVEPVECERAADVLEVRTGIRRGRQPDPPQLVESPAGERFVPADQVRKRPARKFVGGALAGGILGLERSQAAEGIRARDQHALVSRGGGGGWRTTYPLRRQRPRGAERPRRQARAECHDHHGKGAFHRSHPFLRRPSPRPTRRRRCCGRAPRRPRRPRAARRSRPPGSA